MAKRLLRLGVIIVLLCGILFLWGAAMVTQPSLKSGRPSTLTVEPEILRGHVTMLSETLSPRDYKHKQNLELCADYIATRFGAANAAVTFQPVPVGDFCYSNVIARFGISLGSKLVIGAHYDACGAKPAADDNASGVAVLLELSALLQRFPPQREIELVAYVLEEPPFFRTPQMGSVVHATALQEAGEELVGVIVLDMVGYFSDAKNSQLYPTPLFKPLYPNRGNFLSLVGLWEQGAWVKQVKVKMRGVTDLPIHSIRAPASTIGVDLSDHRSYWPHGYNALLLTDTAFLRNLAYHQDGDTADRLDYHKMAKVTIALFEATKTLR